MRMRSPESVESAEGNFRLLKHVGYPDLLGMHAGVVTNDELVAVSARNRTRARTVAAWEGAERREISVHEPRRRLLGKHCVGIKVVAHHAVIGCVHAPAGTGCGGANDVEIFEPTVRILDCDQGAFWLAVRTLQSVHH